jgi:hypothetical protein
MSNLNAISAYTFDFHLLSLLLVGRYWVPRYLLLPGTAATLAYCTNPDDRWGWFLEQLVE